MSATRSVRALVIGAGPGAVDMHLPVLEHLKKSGQLELSLLCDLDSQRASLAAARFGFIETTTDAAAAVHRATIDVVYIFGSAQMHFEMGLAALNARKHIFVEKPAAPSFAQAQQLSAAALQHGGIAVVGHNRRFYRSLALVRARAGATNWRSLEAVCHKPEFGKPPPYGARSWLTANGIHALDAMLFMMDEAPEFLSASSSGFTNAAPDVFSALLRWRSGTLGSFVCNNSSGARREEYVFHGVAESYRITEDGVSIEKDGRVERIVLPSLGDGITQEHEAFIAAVNGGAEPVNSLRRVSPSLRLAELIEDGFSGDLRCSEITPPSASSKIDFAQGILVSQAGTMQSALAPLAERYRLISLEEITQSHSSHPDLVAAILGRGSPALSPEILAKLPNLKIVGIIGLSVANFLPEDLTARNIALVNSSDAYADSVAEFALGLALLARRRAFQSHAAMRAGNWGTSLANESRTTSAVRAARPTLRRLGLEAVGLKLYRHLFPAASSPRRLGPRDLRGASVGLIGWGHNAAAFAHLLAAIGARIVVYSEHARQQDLVAQARLVSLDEALSADVVSLHRGLTAQTRHFMGARELNKLRAGAVLINVARGELIESAALLERLRRGDIFACLDTFNVEPLERASALRAMPNVFLTSHIAGGSIDMRESAAREVVGKILGYLEGSSSAALSRERLLTMT